MKIWEDRFAEGAELMRVLFIKYSIFEVWDHSVRNIQWDIPVLELVRQKIKQNGFTEFKTINVKLVTDTEVNDKAYVEWQRWLE